MIEGTLEQGQPEAGAMTTHARQFTGEVIASEPVMGDSVLLTMTAPAGMALAARAGHFIDIACRGEGSFDPLLRRPYSVYSADSGRNTLTVLVRPYGRGSAWLVKRQSGDLLDVLGLLGNTFTISPKAQNLLLVAGGVGAAPLVKLAEEAVARGLNVTYAMGAADAAGLLAPVYLPGPVEYVAATDDGSQGHHGFVTDLVPDYLSWADQIFACGPEPMFRSLWNVVVRHRIGDHPRVQVSMERTMACGLGACLGCVVETRHGMQTSCVQGPVYDMDDVRW